MRIITFYTDKDYKVCVDRLKKSAAKFGYEIYVGYFPNASNWPAAIIQKVNFIVQQYQNGNGPLLYLDADTEIKSKLNDLEKFILKYDISVRQRDLQDKYNCGVMGFGTNKKKILPFLITWNTITGKRGLKFQTVDQKPFETSLGIHKNIVIGKLPTPYNFMDHDLLHNYGIADSIIYHYKYSKIGEKSRQWKKYLLEKDKKNG